MVFVSFGLVLIVILFAIGIFGVVWTLSFLNQRDANKIEEHER